MRRNTRKRGRTKQDNLDGRKWSMEEEGETEEGMEEDQWVQDNAEPVALGSRWRLCKGCT